MPKISFCPNCEKEVVPKTEQVEEEIPIRSEKITVRGVINICPLCGMELLDKAYDNLLEKANMEYRRRHGLANPDDEMRY